MGIEEHIGDYGVAVALIIGAVLIIRVVMSSLVTIASLWREAAKERNRIQEEAERERRKLDEKQLDAFEALVQKLTSVDAVQGDIKVMVADARREHTALIATIQDSGFGLEALSTKIDGLPAQTAVAVRAELKEDLERIRAAAASVTLSIDGLVAKLDALPIATASVAKVRAETVSDARAQIAQVDARTGTGPLTPASTSTDDTQQGG